MHFFLVQGLITGEDGLFYRLASTQGVNLATCVGLCAASPGFSLPQAKTAKTMAYIRKRKPAGANNYLDT